METVRVCWSISEDNGEEDAAVGVTSPRHVTRTDGVRRCLHNRSVTGDDDDDDTTTTRRREFLKLLIEANTFNEAVRQSNRVALLCKITVLAKTPGVRVTCVDRVYSLHTGNTQLCSPSKAATIKKQTKQRKRSEINHCKISQTQQDNTFQY